MARLFLTLYGVLALTLGAFVVALEYLPERLLRPTTQQYFERILGGSFQLIEEELTDAPEAEWADVISELQPHFGYPIALRPLDEHGFEGGERDRLFNGRVVFNKVDGAGHLYKRIGNSDHFLSMVLEQTDTEATLRSAEGTAHLILQRFQARPQEDWPVVIQELRSIFGFSLSVTPIAQAKVPEEQRSVLEAGELLVFDNNTPDERYFQRIPNSDFVFLTGPIGLPFLVGELGIIVLVLLALLVALAVYAWIRPVWRDLSRFDRTAAAFGGGDFEARLSVERSSGLSRLAETFNGMAARIQGLLRSHKELTNAVSHELRTPIARLRFGIDMLADSSDEIARQRFLDGMKADIDDLDALVSELLTYARFDRETPKLEFQRQNVPEWIEAVVEHARLDAGDVTLECIAAESHAKLRAAFEPKLMARALANLLRNARRHARERVQVGFALQSGQCRIWVDDDGSGVPDEARERILEPFNRLMPAATAHPVA